MMKNVKQIIFTLVELNAIVILLLVYVKIDSINIIESKDKTITAIINQSIYQNSIAKYQLYSEASTLNLELKLICENSVVKNIDDVVNGKVLVLRYSELNCQSCVDTMLTQIKSNSNFSNENTLLLAYYKNPAYLYQFKRMNRLRLPVYSINKTGLPPDTLNIPYFYLLDKDLRVSNVFIPEEGDTSSIAAYLRFAAKRLQSNM